MTDMTEANIGRWDALFASRTWGRYPPEELVRFIARNFGSVADRKAVRVLEVGCGTGANLWYLAKEGFAIAGIDGSRHAIDAVDKRLREENLPAAADLRVGNFATLPWPDASFDAVIDIEAIYANRLAVIQSVVREIHRVLKPGGLFFGKMFGPKTDGVSTGEMLEDGTTRNPLSGPLADTGLVHAFTEDELQRIFQSFAELAIDWVHRSDRNRTYEIFEWLVQARK